MEQRAMEELRTLAGKMAEQQNKLIEAIWRAIVGNDTPTKEDGELIVLGHSGPEVKYSFMYKGKHAATLTIKEGFRGGFSYFLEPESVTIWEVMQKLREIEVG